MVSVRLKTAVRGCASDINNESARCARALLESRPSFYLKSITDGHNSSDADNLPSVYITAYEMAVLFLDMMLEFTQLPIKRLGTGTSLY